MKQVLTGRHKISRGLEAHNLTWRTVLRMTPPPSSATIDTTMTVHAQVAATRDGFSPQSACALSLD